jgi:hypothetical protein
MTACGSSNDTVAASASVECANVVDVVITADAGGTFGISVTVASADTGWDKYADGWDVVANGAVIATRVLAHPHVDEQPFTRSLANVEIPPAIDSVVIRADDVVAGNCGDTMNVLVPHP